MSDAFLTDLPSRHIRLMQKTVATLGSVLQRADPVQLATLRDGVDGWTVVEVLCHLRDFDEIFYQRAVQIVNEDNPTLQPYDHEALARERRYNEQDLTEVYAALRESRARFAAYFTGLTDDQWERAGTHPERGRFTLTDAVIQVGHHDADHIEQITRILAQ